MNRFQPLSRRVPPNRVNTVSQAYLGTHIYSVEGIDGQEYGPVDMDTLKSWASAGRIHWDSEIHDRTSNMRTRAGSMEKLRPLLQQVPPLPEEIATRRAGRIYSRFFTLKPQPKTGDDIVSLITVIIVAAFVVAGLLACFFLT